MSRSDAVGGSDAEERLRSLEVVHALPDIGEGGRLAVIGLVHVRGHVAAVRTLIGFEVRGLPPLRGRLHDIETG